MFWFLFCLFWCVEFWVATFSSGQASRGVSLSEKRLERSALQGKLRAGLCIPGGVRFSLGKCLPVCSKHGLWPATLQGREQANREREEDNQREREWKSWLPNWITPSFFLQTSYCQDHGDFLFSLILREKGRGGFKTRLLCPQRCSWYRWPAKHTLLCHERWKCRPAIYWCSVDLLRVVFMGKVDSLWPNKYKKICIKV